MKDFIERVKAFLARLPGWKYAVGAAVLLGLCFIGKFFGILAGALLLIIALRQFQK
jgi:hypothetical protein